MLQDDYIPPRDTAFRRSGVRSFINEYLLTHYKYRNGLQFVRHGDKLEEKLRYGLLMQGYTYDEIYPTLEKRLSGRLIMTLMKEKLGGIDEQH